MGHHAKDLLSRWAKQAHIIDTKPIKRLMFACLRSMLSKANPQCLTVGHGFTLIFYLFLMPCLVFGYIKH
jgi:hypothetical protein